jgi:hypothetical protein
LQPWIQSLLDLQRLDLAAAEGARLDLAEVEGAGLDTWDIGREAVRPLAGNKGMGLESAAHPHLYLVVGTEMPDNNSAERMN